MQARGQLLADMEGLREQNEQLFSELGSTTRHEIAGAQAIRHLHQEVATLQSQALHHAVQHQVSLVLLTGFDKHSGSCLHILTQHQKQVCCAIQRGWFWSSQQSRCT